MRSDLIVYHVHELFYKINRQIGDEYAQLHSALLCDELLAVDTYKYAAGKLKLVKEKIVY